MEKFYEVVDRVTRESVPTKLRRVGNKPLWMTANIMRMLLTKCEVMQTLRSFHQRLECLLA
jgi:hypothetical protein